MVFLAAAVASVLLSTSTPPMLASMPGIGGDDKRVDVPHASEIWQATVTDSTLTETALDEFSIDGYTHIQGALGAGTISIRFEEIAKIDFEPGEKGKCLALVTLKNGLPKKIVVDGKVPLYGKTGFGSFKVLVKDTRHVALTAGPIKRSEKAGAEKSGGAPTARQSAP